MTAFDVVEMLARVEDMKAVGKCYWCWMGKFVKERDGQRWHQRPTWWWQSHLFDLECHDPSHAIDIRDAWRIIARGETFWWNRR